MLERVARDGFAEDYLLRLGVVEDEGLLVTAWRGEFVAWWEVEGGTYRTTLWESFGL